MTHLPVRIRNAHKYYNKGKSNQLHVMDNITLELPEEKTAKAEQMEQNNEF